MTRPNDQRLLKNGRENNISEAEYNGPRPANLAFDPTDLYCYLQGNTEPNPGIEAVIELFERQFHDLPEMAKQEIRMDYRIPSVKQLREDTSENADFLLDLNAVETFVSNYLSHYLHRNSLPPLGRDTELIAANTSSSSGIRESPRNKDGDQTASLNNSSRTPSGQNSRPPESTEGTPQTPGDVISIPLLSETATAGYRTGRNLGRYARELWHHLIGTTDDQADVAPEKSVTKSDE